jgi:hypothetical protein
MEPFDSCKAVRDSIRIGRAIDRAWLIAGGMDDITAKLDCFGKAAIATDIYRIICNTHSDHIVRDSFSTAAMGQRERVAMNGSDTQAKEMMKRDPAYFTDAEFKAMSIRRPKAKAL